MPGFERLDTSTYGEGWVQVKGGVAWVKQVAAAMDPGAVGAQITAYQQAAEQIAYAQKVLKTTQGNLDASWTGQAATAAQQTFQGSVNHAQLIQDTINQDIVPHLQTVQQAQQEFIDTMMNVPDEKPLTQDALLYMQTNSWMHYPANFPGRTLVEHNTAARTQAAAALTTLAGKYSGAAAKLSELQTGGGDYRIADNSTSTFNLGQVAPASGSGSAVRYQSSVRTTTNASGSRSNPPTTAPPGSGVTISGGGTQLASNPSGGNPPSSTPTLPSPVRNPGSGPVPVGGLPPEVLPIGSQSPVTGGYGEGTDPISEGRRVGRAAGYGGEPVEGEMLAEPGTGTGRQFALVGEKGSGSGSAVEYRDAALGEGSAAGVAEGEARGGAASEGMGPLGGMGTGAGAAGRASGSSRYNRGRYFDELEDDGEPQVPSVRSVFEDATDGQGNRLNLLSGRGATGRDDQDERGKRTSKPKEDGLWDSAQRIVPPVIE